MPREGEAVTIFSKNLSLDYAFVTSVLLDISRLLHSFQLTEQPSGLLK